jgi:hypothetical protein
VSFDLIVYYAEPSIEVPRLWRAALATYGLVCDLPLDFAVAKHFGFVPVQPSAGFELSVGDFDPDAVLAELGPDDQQIDPAVARARWIATFTTSSGRSRAEYRAQWLAAAALVQVTGGLLYDPQAGTYYRGDSALAVAERAELRTR